MSLHVTTMTYSDDEKISLNTHTGISRGDQMDLVPEPPYVRLVAVIALFVAVNEIVRSGNGSAYFART